MSNRARNRIDKRRLALELAREGDEIPVEPLALLAGVPTHDDESDDADVITTKAGERVNLRAPWRINTRSA